MKVVIQVSDPITKKFQVKDTIKCGRIDLNYTDYVIFVILASIGIFSLISSVISKSPLYYYFLALLH